jgi:hypothetical protein
MFAPKPHRGGSPGPLFHRLDRAAAALNPVLALIAVGLVLINIIVVLSMTVPLGPTFPRPDAACTSVPSQTGSAGQSPEPAR